jgi:hypothetical protein
MFRNPSNLITLGQQLLCNKMIPQKVHLVVTPMTPFDIFFVFMFFKQNIIKNKCLENLYLSTQVKYGHTQPT